LSFAAIGLVGIGLRSAAHATGSAPSLASVATVLSVTAVVMFSPAATVSVTITIRVFFLFFQPADHLVESGLPELIALQGFIFL
jgi:hypothetical protein